MSIEGLILPPGYEAKTPEDRVGVYLHKYDSNKSGSPVGTIIEIPFGDSKTINFKKAHHGYDTHRNAREYKRQLFSDQFMIAYDDHNRLDYLKRRPSSDIVAGGIERVMAPGHRVLDLGSGGAVGLLQLAREFREAVLVGVDHNYDKVIPPDFENPGVSLTKENWTELASIPDKSINAIMSLFGAFLWGVANSREVVKAVSRVADNGAVLRFNCVYSEQRAWREMLEAEGWESRRQNVGSAVFVKAS